MRTRYSGGQSAFALFLLVVGVVAATCLALSLTEWVLRIAILWRML